MSKLRSPEFSGWEKKAYFTANQIPEWLEKHCAAKQRKRHCLSATAKEDGNNHQLSSGQHVQ
jgi:hypothetical protein